MPAGTEQLRYSTPEHLALERRLIARALASGHAGAGQAHPDAVARALAARPTLSEEQRQAVEALCLDGHGVALVAGRAGTGKTFALGAAREAWQASGYAVLGVSIARRAAGELQDGAGIASTSVAALLGDLAGSRRGLPSRCVLVVDEAGMVPTRDLARLLDHVERVRGKLVLVGDDRQLPELAAGGAFGGLIRRGLAVELRENARQVHAWERRTLDQLRAGRAEEALAAYRGHGALDVAPTAHDARARLVADWLAAGDLDQAVMIAQRRIDVADLNERARDQLRASGRLGGRELELPGGAFAVGDRVVIKRNDPRLGVNNGQRGRVVAVDPCGGTLTLAGDGRAWALDAAFLRGVTQAGDPTLLHGYAITGRVAQGLTVDRSFVLATDGMSREWAYVALSRGRRSNRLYLAERGDEERAEFAPMHWDRGDPVARLAMALQCSDGQVLAIDMGRDPGELGEASQAAKDATWQRRQLEGRRFNWLPDDAANSRARKNESAWPATRTPWRSA
jgi:ATP-dependent exoDNAse (exonuclease V) alpha subunit